MLVHDVAGIVKKGTKADTVIKQDVAPQEVDLCVLVWHALATSGASWHVCRPVSFSANELEMERLHGLRDDVVNMEQLLCAAAHGDACVGADFRDMFRTLLFQTLYTLAISTCVFNGLFRHNDLHARNVCFTPWNFARAAVRAKYTLPVFPCRPGEPFANHHFLVTSVYRAVIIDFGWAALLPGLGPDKDSRFYHCVPDAGGQPVMIDSLTSDVACRNCGMSQRVPSHHYDAALFMYSVSSVCANLLRVAEAVVPASVRCEMVAFMEFYTRTYAAIPHDVGRLQVPLQRELLASKTLPGTNVEVPTPQSLLLHPYFSEFRCSESVYAEHCFGVCPDACCAPPSAVLQSYAQSMSLLAGKGQWKKSAGTWTPPVGKFVSLVTEVERSAARWKYTVPKRELDADETDAWSAASAPCTAVRCVETAPGGTPACSPAHTVDCISCSSPRSACGYNEP